MATNTPNYGLRKPDTSDNVIVLTDLADNYDDIDTNLKRIDDVATGSPIARLRQESTQIISDSTWTSISFDAEDFDSHGAHDTSTNNTRYICPVAGYYLFNGGTWLAANAAGVRFNRWAKNGTAIDNGGNEFPVTPAGALWGAPAKGIIIPLNVSDYVQLQVWQNSGGNLNTATAVGGETGSDMSVTYLRPL